MKISLITTTFNSGMTLRDTISSVLVQTFPTIEYIIIDGVSTDGTIEIIKEYECKFNGNMKWISEADRGLYDAMNKGIRMASGDVIGILNSDDYFTSHEILEKIASEFEKDSTIEAIYGDVHYIKPDRPEKCVRYYSSEEFSLERMKKGFMPAHPSFYVRKSCYEKYGLFKTDYKIGADFELLLRLIYVNHIKIKYLPLDMVTMRVGGVSTQGLKSHVRIMKEHLRAFKENHVSTNICLLMSRYFTKLKELR